MATVSRGSYLVRAHRIDVLIRVFGRRPREKIARLIFLSTYYSVSFPPLRVLGSRGAARLGVAWMPMRLCTSSDSGSSCKRIAVCVTPRRAQQTVLPLSHFEPRDVPAKCRWMVPAVSRLAGVSGVGAAGPVRQRSVCHGDCPAFCSANVRNRERSDPVRLCIRKREGGGTDHAFSSIFRGTRSRYREERVLANRPPYRRVERRRRWNPDCKGCPY